MTTRHSPATKPGTYDSTPIDRLRVHLVVDGKVVCSAQLTPIFGDGRDQPITCARCAAKSVNQQVPGGK